MTAVTERGAGAYRTCAVRDRRFVEPCDSLAGAADVGGLSKAKGIGEWSYFVEGNPSRTFYGVRSNEHRNGLLFNFCPWCGVDISAPFVEPAR